MDRIGNARHFAPRLLRYLNELGAQTTAPSKAPSPPAASAPAAEAPQLDLFAQAPFAAPPPLFKAPPRPTPVLPMPSVGPNDAPLRKIQLGSHTVHYVLRRSARRSHGFTISDDGLYVTSPRRAPLDDVERAIRAKQNWILTKLFERSARRSMRAERAPVAWVDGARLPYLGADLTLRLVQAERGHCTFDPEARELRLGVTPGQEETQIRERVKSWFQGEARRLFGERLDLYAPRIGVRHKAFALSSAGTRWGSCTAAGNIRLNWRLVHYPLGLVDYVVVHELAHLREMNHSPAFWAVVGAVFPDYDGARAGLKKRASEMPVLFPDA